MEHEPVSIVGVITEEVGSPRNDGSRGSGLYAVPIRLSRALGADEANVFEHVWDNPPQFTSMHRPGTGRVSGDRFVLGATTVEEVADYHAKTLGLVVDAFNQTMTDLRQQQEQERQRAADAEAAHRAHIDDVAKNIRFD